MYQKLLEADNTDTTEINLDLDLRNQSQCCAQHCCLIGAEIRILKIKCVKYFILFFRLNFEFEFKFSFD